MNILLLRSFIHKAYFRSNYIFRHLVSNEISFDTNISYCIVASNRIYDQPDDGLRKRPKHVVAPKVRYVNKAPSNNTVTVCV